MTAIQNPFSLQGILNKELKDCKTILDLGCGNESPLKHLRTDYALGIDIFERYLRESKLMGVHNDYLKADLTRIDFKPKSFDAVILLYALEHMKKEDGWILVEKMKQWSKKKVIVTTPNGFLPQEACDNNPYMEHRSGWTVEEFEENGFRVKGISGWKRTRSRAIEGSQMWSRISDVTQPLIYFHPRLAFQLFAVYDLS